MAHSACCGGHDELAATVAESASAGTRVLTPGNRIDVLWVIERNDEDMSALSDPVVAPSQTEERWWGARVLRRDGEGPGYTLLYDAYKEFPPAEVEVTLLGPHELSDKESGGDVMRWRMEGTELDVDDEIDQTVSMCDVVAAQDEVDAEEGVVAGDVMMAALNSLPMLQQAEMAIKYRSFADELKDELGKLTAERGPGHVVSEADIRKMFAKIRDAAHSSAGAP
jgi:hypothetical protein